MLTKTFYDTIRNQLFNHSMLGSQVSGIQAIYDACIAYGITDIHQIAYILATAYHETAKTMQPIREYGGHDYFMQRYDISGKNPTLAKQLGNTIIGDGATYCGRGYVMITGRANYQKFSNILKIDFVKDPDYAMLLENAAKIAIYGMMQGIFTGKKLSDYINGTTCNYLSARRIINGTDKSDLIATYALKFQTALTLDH